MRIENFRGHLFSEERRRRIEQRLIAGFKMPKSSGTSLSDSGFYPALCDLASRNSVVFRVFRRSLIYRSVLEHVSEDQGHLYLRSLIENGPLSQDQIELCLGDRVGWPRRYWYGELGRVSPTTLRYLKVASDIEALFGSINSLHVGEIGSGYGGQLRVLDRLTTPASYALFDLPEALNLTRRFLYHCGGVSIPNLLTVDGRTPQTFKLDLVISNYAFSELDRQLQEEYLQKVVLNSARGYVTYNHISNSKLNSMTALEFAERVPGSKLIQETPLTHALNCIVVWGHK